MIDNFLKRKTLTFILVLFSLWGNAQELKEKELELKQLRAKELVLLKEVEELKLKSTISDMKKVGLPTSNKKLTVVEHNALTIGFNEAFRMASWTFHVLVPDVITGGVTRTNDFRPDPKLEGKTAVEEDYFITKVRDNGSISYEGFGFDRGHLAPSADFRWSEKGLSESYFYSNMTPQRPGFNRESWAEVENLLRRIIENNPKRYFVLTGPVLHDSLPAIEQSVNQIQIPELHYKIIVDMDEKDPKGMAFLMPNKKCENPLFSYIVSIDSVEKVTGLNFFPNLSAEMEQKIESKADYNAWKVDKEGKDVAPVDQTTLPPKTYNTIEAKYRAGFTTSVVGKVVSTKLTERTKATFLNLDQSFPNQIFSITIWGTNRKNFSYLPEEHLDGKYIRITGEVLIDKNGIPSINATNEKQIELWDEINGQVIKQSTD